MRGVEIWSVEGVQLRFRTAGQAWLNEPANPSRGGFEPRSSSALDC